MKALIDADMLLYELAAGGEDKKEGLVFSFETLIPRIEQKIQDICDAVGATSHVLYITGKGNFREKIATVKKYKGNRDGQEKPFHYANVKAYMMSLGAVLVEGMEADDAMAIEQTLDAPCCPVRGEHVWHPDLCDTVICTRDKDLRMVPGFHFGWECGLQPEYSLRWVDELGQLELTPKRKIKGDGLKFFYSQILTGDRTDNIPGLAGCGDVAAYNTLKECNTEGELLEAVLEAYLKPLITKNPMGFAVDKETEVESLTLKYKPIAREQVLEQGRLLWMVRELDEKGEPVMWEIPDE